MSYGLEVIGQNSIQIDSVYKNHSLKEIISVAAGHDGRYKTTLSTNVYPSPLLCIDCIPTAETPNPYVALIYCSGGSNEAYFDFIITTSVGYRVLIFTTENSNNSGGDYGLTVNDSSGGVVFTSRNKYLRVVGHSSHSNFRDAPDETFSISGKKLRAIFNCPSYDIGDLFRPGLNTIYLRAARISGNSVSLINSVTLFPTADASSTYPIYQQYVLVADITGY